MGTSRSGDAAKVLAILTQPYLPTQPRSFHPALPGPRFAHAKTHC